ncbi:LysR family transcriptional regulator [Roseovarius aestuarii]|uniref:Glycine cleavage system transcriptional activator n=1 Tax=Roseovarius aestuarii TaxID=475083 RepID=A0A1X7BW54_9RHOB|nr:LysR family transcriptional regulator [Roseovarius aestuarii]SMC13459.1 Glycine cleavage system transcriptional activator [Roseovarius aestuarii]
MAGKGQINLTWLRSFEAASRHLSFTEASTELGLTQTAVSLHIRSLEEQVGSKLFLRRARHLTLTEIGQAYVTTVRQALSDIDLVSASLFGPMTSRMITIKAPISTATLWLTPRLPLFRRAFPGIDLRLVSHIWTEATHTEGVDIELRLGRGNWTDAQSEKLSNEFIVPICAESQQGNIKEVADLQRGPLIHILGHEGNWERYFGANSCAMPLDVPQYFLDTSISAMQLVASGGGYATVLTRLIETRGGIASGIAPAGHTIPFPDAHYLMRRNSKHAVRPEVELFETWLREQFAQDTDPTELE